MHFAHNSHHVIQPLQEFKPRRSCGGCCSSLDRAQSSCDEPLHTSRYLQTVVWVSGLVECSDLRPLRASTLLGNLKAVSTLQTVPRVAQTRQVIRIRLPSAPSLLSSAKCSVRRRLAHSSRQKAQSLHHMSAPSDLLSKTLPSMWPLAKTLIRSRKEAVVALSTTTILVWATLQLTGLWQLATGWLIAEFAFIGYQRWR